MGIVRNIGAADQIVRLLIAVVTAVLGYISSPWWYVVTVVAAVTAILGYCGLYSLLGMNTLGEKAVPAKAPKPTLQKKSAKSRR